MISRSGQRFAEEKTKAEPTGEAVRTPVPLELPSQDLARVVRRERTVPGKEEEVVPASAPSEGKGGRRHRYLQGLVKRMAEENGYRAVIEGPTPDGLGQVDVSLERNDRTIACEISITSTGQQELSNIRKCLAAGYDTVVLCSPRKRTLDKVKALVSQELEESDREKVLLLQPEELFFHLAEEAAAEPAREERVKGYRVRVRHQPLGEAEEKQKREAIAQVIIQALRRLRDED